MYLFNSFVKVMTARDRPYKKAAPHDFAIKILRSMVDEGKLDSELVEIFIESGFCIQTALMQTLLPFHQH